MTVDSRSDPARLVHPERVTDVLDRLPDSVEVQGLANQFKLLSDPGREHLITILPEAGEFCVGDVAAEHFRHTRSS